jgi:uncharacterized RDD family membrane protein YckC
MTEEGGGVRGRLSHLAGSLSNRVLEELDPDAVVDRLDVNGLVARVDVDGLIDRVDVDRLLRRVDVNAVLQRVEIDPLLASVDVDELLARADVDRLLARVDVDGLLDRVDVDRLLRRVDVNGLLDRVDVDRLLRRVDVNGLLDRVDVDRLLRRVDVNGLLDRVDVDPLLERADVESLLDRVDVQRLVERIDLDQVAGRLDIDAVVERIDLERMLGTVDLEALVRRAGIPELVAESTGQVAGSALDLGRRQLVGLDVGVSRVLQRMLGRDPDALPAGPPLLVADQHAAVQPPEPGQARVKARVEVSGFYAGPVSRLVAFAADVAVATSSFTVVSAAASWVLATLFGVALGTVDRRATLWAAAFFLWLLLYWWVSSAVAGRTPIMALAGLRIVAREGTPLRPGPALVRTVLLPVSLAFFGFGGLWMVVDRERRGFHDLGARSTVVYDWGGRPAEMPTPLARWIAEHGAGT